MQPLANQRLFVSGLREGELRIGSGLKYGAALSGVLLCGVRSLTASNTNRLTLSQFGYLSLSPIRDWRFEIRRP